MSRLLFQRQVFLKLADREGRAVLSDVVGKTEKKTTGTGYMLGCLWCRELDPWFTWDGQPIRFTTESEYMWNMVEVMASPGSGLTRGPEIDSLEPDSTLVIMLEDLQPPLEPDSTMVQVADYFEQTVVPYCEPLLAEIDEFMRQDNMPVTREIPRLGQESDQFDHP